MPTKKLGAEQYQRSIEAVMVQSEAAVEDMQRKATQVLRESVHPFLRERVDDPAFKPVVDAVESILGELDSELAWQKRLRAKMEDMERNAPQAAEGEGEGLELAAKVRKPPTMRGRRGARNEENVTA